MTYQRFEDLPVWQEAIRLAHLVYDLTENSEIEGPRRLNQAARNRYQQKQRADAFRKKLLMNLPPEHPLRKQAEEDEADE